MTGFHHEETTQDWDKMYYNCPEALQFYDMAINHMCDLLQAPADKPILDAGCGAAVHAIRVARSGYEIDAIDFSKSAIEDGKLRVHAAGLDSHIHFQQEDMRQLTLSDASYQTIYCWGVVIHIREIEKALDELARVLAPKGRLALYVTNSSALQLLPRKLKKSLKRQPYTLIETPLGSGFEFDWHGENIWIWLNHVDGLVEYLGNRGLQLVEKQAGEFTDYGLHFSGNWISRVIWWINVFWFRYRLPANLALTNLLIFEKSSSQQ